MTKFYFLIVLLMNGILVFAQESYNNLVYEGNRAFDKKNYTSASSKFMEAAKVKNKDFTSHYNLGNALYKDKKYQEAMAEYKKAESFAQNQNDKNAVAYNMGNAHMQAGDAPKAAEYYKKALKSDPYNEKVRKNYQIAMLKDKNDKQKQDQNKDQSKGGGDGKDKNQSNDSKDGKNPNDGQGNQQKGNGAGEDSNQNKKPNQGSNMPKDLQDAILDRVKGKERETTRKILNKNATSMPQSNEKDW